jgi:hypothetical protein
VSRRLVQAVSGARCAGVLIQVMRSANFGSGYAPIAVVLFGFDKTRIRRDATETRHFDAWAAFAGSFGSFGSSGSL